MRISRSQKTIDNVVTLYLYVSTFLDNGLQDKYSLKLTAADTARN